MQFKMNIAKSYLGDSVYAEWDGHSVKLTTENGYPDDPSNEIYLEPEVVVALVNFLFSVAKIIDKPNQ